MKKIDLIKKIALRWDITILVFLILVYIFILATLSILRHDAFASYYDLANMDSTLWNTLHGNFFSLRIADDLVSRLSIHADFILALLSPIYFIWDNVRMLLITQSVLLGLGAIPTYFLARKILKNKILSLTIVVVYLLNPALQWTNMDDFHGVTIVIPFFLSAFYFAYVKKWKWFSLFVFLSFLTKEEISLNIMMLGFTIFFVFRQRVAGILTVIAGATWFFTMVYWLIPYAGKAASAWAWGRYGVLFDSGGNVATSKLGLQALQIFLNPDALAYYNGLLKPFSYLPLLGFPWLLVSLPEIAINVLSDNKAQTTIYYHYVSGILPILIIALIFGLSYLFVTISKRSLFKRYKKFITYSLCIILLAVALRINYHYSPLPTTPSCWCQIYNVTSEDKAFEKVLQGIPKDASITASIEIRPHVNHRKNVWFIPYATSSAQFIALITQNRIVGNYEPKVYENQLIPLLLSDKNYKLLFKSEHFYLFKRSEVNELSVDPNYYQGLLFR